MTHTRTTDELKIARKHLLEGISPGGCVAEGIERSWHRSRAEGLHPTGNRSVRLPDDAEMPKLRQDNERLLAFARPEIQTLYRQIAGSNSAILLTDANGIILEREGDPEFRERSQRVALRPGACWHESVRGTNAIGLTLAEGRASTVHGPEHFLDCNTFLTCAAAPIRDPYGQTLGLLDVSGDQPARQLHGLGLVRMGAIMIENRMLEAEFPDALYLHFHSRPEFVGTLAQGIAAFDASGRLLAVNAVAAEFLADGSGTPFHVLLDKTLDEALAAGDHGLFRARTREGLEVQGKISRMSAPSRDHQKDSTGDLHLGDPSIKREAHRALRVLKQGIPLVIQGESGTGKEWLTRMLHEHGPRSEGPLVCVNCAAIPEGLVEAELFGYAPGAFTGAHPQGAEGRIRQANGGTLFLDEIGDMPPELQTRLLRVLQERSVTPLGGRDAQPVDFDLISATHQDLTRLVAEGRFRADLYYRICGLRVELPPLRDRQDLSALIDQCLREADPEAWLTRECRERLVTYQWPGNLRELRNTIRTAAALREPGRPIDPDALPWDLAKPDEPVNSTDLRATERRAIRNALDRHDGNVTAAARSLGISRSTLYRHLRNDPGRPENDF